MTGGGGGVGERPRGVLEESSVPGWAPRLGGRLRGVGFDRAALLDGGLTAGGAEGRPLSTAAVSRPAKQLTPAPRPELIADRDEVLASIADDAVSLIDTLPAAFYRGEMTIYARPGHIPGASNLCGLDLLDKSGRFLPDNELAAMHGGDHNARTIPHALALLERNDLPRAALELQMLHGMASPLKHAAVEMDLRVREYVPQGELIAGIGYLDRRLPENTSNSSCLRSALHDHVTLTTTLAPPPAITLAPSRYPRRSPADPGD